MKRYQRRLTSIVTIAMVTVLLLAPARVSAQTSRSWESGAFGYEIEWARGWEFDDENSGTYDDGEVLQLMHPDQLIVLQIVLLPIEDMQDPGEALDFYVDEISSALDADEVDMSARGEDPWWLGSTTSEGGELGVYVEAYEYEDAMVLVAVIAMMDGLEDSIAMLADEISIDGVPVLVTLFGAGGNGVDDPVRSTEGGATADGDYVAWTHPAVQLSFDPDAWVVDTDESAEDAVSGRDTLVLLYADDAYLAAAYVETYDDYNGDVQDCLDAAVEEAIGESDPRALDDQDGAPIEGDENGRAWIGYTFRNADGDRLSTHVECRLLPDEEGVVVTTLIAARADFETVYPDFLDIVDSIEFVEDDGGRTGGSTGGEELGGVITFAEYGVEITYDEALFISAMDDGTGGAILVTDDGATFFVFALAQDSDMTAAECADGVAMVFSDGASDLVLAEDDNGDPIAAVEEGAAYGLYTFTMNREDQVMVASCTATADEEAFVTIIGIGPIDTAETVVGVYLELVDGSDFLAG